LEAAVACNPDRVSDRLRDAWTVLRRAVAEARDDGVPTTAQALAYSLFLAIPAIFLVLLGLFSVFADESAIEELVSRASAVMPAEAATLLEDSLRRTAQGSSGGILMTLFGLALAFWTTTSAASTLMAGLTTTFDRKDERAFVRKRLIALAIVLALGLGAALVLGLLVLGPHVERWIGDATGAPTVTAWAWWTAQWPILVLALLFAFAIVLYFGPHVDQPSWQLVTPGAVTALLVWLAASGGLAVYAAYFGSYEKTWGTLSAVIVTLLWLWVTNAALLFGAEVNAEVARLAADRGDRDAAAAVAEAESTPETTATARP
jgi:membrane protein